MQSFLQKVVHQSPLDHQLLHNFTRLSSMTDIQNICIPSWTRKFIINLLASTTKACHSNHVNPFTVWFIQLCFLVVITAQRWNHVKEFPIAIDQQTEQKNGYYTQLRISDRRVMLGDYWVVLMVAHYINPQYFCLLLVCFDPHFPFLVHAHTTFLLLFDTLKLLMHKQHFDA